MTNFKTETRNLTVKLTNDEIRQLGEELADLNQHEIRLKNEIKSYTSFKKSELDTNKEKISMTADKIRTGETVEMVKCTIAFDTPKNELKTVTRTDTDESWTEPMTQDDYDLFLNAEKEVF